MLDSMINTSSVKGFQPPHRLANANTSLSVLLALSGGPDSVSLLHLLSADAKEKGYTLYAAHVNHGIREEEADRDEDFCRTLTASLDVKFFSLRTQIPALAKETGQSVETAARNVRYSFFSEIMKQHHIPILATAHNANDNLETILFDLTRGTGLDGLCGIPPVRDFADGYLVRPLLAVSRTDILAFCAEHHLTYVTDTTNTDTAYTRNRIRTHLLPRMMELNPALLDGVNRLCGSLREDAAYLNQQALSFLESHELEDAIPLSDLAALAQPILARVLMRRFKETSGVALEHCHVEALKELIRKKPASASLSLPNSYVASFSHGRLRFQKRTPDVLPDVTYTVRLIEGYQKISQTNCEIVMGNSQTPINIYKKSICLYFPFDKIKGNVIARNRQPRDRIFSGGMHKDVRKLMNERKIPLSLRARIPILCDENGILAVPFVACRDGMRLSKEHESSAYPITLYFDE